MILAILQARISSSRFPGKVLKPILGTPMVWHQWQRVKRSKLIDAAVLATSTDSSDDALAQYFFDRGELLYRGSLFDVLDRFYQCALRYQASHIVRLTADCPLLDPMIIDQVIERHLVEKNDYTSNGFPHHTFPDGLNVEVIRFHTLEKAHQEACMSSQREHVTLYVYQHPEKFKLGGMTYHKDLSAMRWTVDYSEDFMFVTKIYEMIYPNNPHFSTQDVLDLLKNQPELMSLNSQYKRYEGLMKSLKNDKIVK